MSDSWIKLQPHLRQLLGDEEYSSWIEPLELHHSSTAKIILSSKNPIVFDWVRDHLLRDIRTVARSQFGADFEIDLSSPRNHGEPTADQLETISPQAGDLDVDRFLARYAIVAADFTFDNFVNGPSNQFAAAAAAAVADRPGAVYNPLYIYGGSGLGKTHLLHAVANLVLAKDPDKRVVYLTTEQFVNLLIDCIRRRTVDRFRQVFRAADVLLLDDIQFIAGKERTQEEFFHTFNTLQAAGRQVVFTSDQRPADLDGLAERLRTRFMQGLLADIQPPDLETRCAILREKARASGYDLAEDVVLFISRRIKRNVRELEGSLNRILAYAQLTGQEISVSVARSALSELLGEERVPTAAEIIRFVAHHYGVRVVDLKGRSNRRSIVVPRQVAMFLIRTILQSSYPEIGKIFSKHHTTVMHAVDAVGDARASNPDFDATLTSFVEHFGA